MSKNKVLIFGYCGFVGPYLADEFINAGYDVFGSDIVDSKEQKNGIDVFKCNLLDLESVKNIINEVKPDYIINLAAISSVGASWKNPQLTISVNVIGTLNILEAAKELLKKPRVLFVGSSEEYEESDSPISEINPLSANNPYGISKFTQERFAKLYSEQFGLKVYCVRPFNHTGVGQKDTFVLPSFCKQVAEVEKTGKPGKIYVGNLSAKRDFSDVRDVVRAYRMILENDDNSIIYNVGSGKAYSIEELLSFIISFSSQKVEIIIDKEKYRPIDTPFICCDNSLIRKKLGWEPSYDIKDTLKEMFNYYLNK